MVGSNSFEPWQASRGRNLCGPIMPLYVLVLLVLVATNNKCHNESVYDLSSAWSNQGLEVSTLNPQSALEVLLAYDLMFSSILSAFSDASV